MEFLLQNQFSLNSLYNNGVRYLSREEEDIAMAKASARFNRTKSHAVMEVRETEHDSIEFVEAVRKLVKDWLALGKDRESYLNIPPPSRDTMNDDTKLMPSTLNNYRKRLVHQLIEVEYPSLVTISHPTFIQVIDYDEEREKAHAKYNGRKNEHEAGYDSLLTAQVFIKLSAQLRDGGVSETAKPTKPQSQPNKQSSKQKRSAKKTGDIGLPTRFDVLGIDEVGDTDRDLASGDEDIRRDEAAEKASKGHLIPRSGADFWTVYSNKLRVFGTESVCHVGNS
ncbi:hypothetical protein N8T08_001865 [Aspergillus melleus]|uniref:Uncharacterized protein n=1 Tax=Aspergillus melleus TaxID=138277 RepID=A0ACC3BA12_9EURO|nr:hypothetical protein N8T08_001865 [Aspergillus melleus]